jgi:hypothetical protein
MRPVHVETASASAVAAKNIFMGSELGGGGACVGIGVSSFGPSSFAPSDLGELGGATFRGEDKASPSYVIVNDARGFLEVRRNCHERSRCSPNICRPPVIAKKRIVGAKNSPRQRCMRRMDWSDAANVISEYRPLKF